jgi:eukaryotic-like serine/threonine-protein kinase
LHPFVGSIVEDRYRIEAELGAGAMGSVYRGRHIKVGRTVAIKVLHDHLVREPEMVERFEREARIAAKLQHPNLVGVLDIGETPDGKKLIVLEFAPGRSLAELVGMPRQRDRVIALARQLLCGLEHAHELGLVHRDLKPENVLVERTTDGTEIPRIVDFGIATLRDGDDAEERRLTTTGMVLGTPMYMAPEQARGERVDQRADLFAMGVIVYELLAGTTPFEGSGLEVIMLNQTHDAPSVHARTGRDVDPLLEAFARTLMARDPANRFQSATDALRVLDLIAHDRDAAARAFGLTAPVPERIEEPVVTKRERQSRVEMQPLPRRDRWGAALGAAALVVSLIALCVALA